MNLRQLEIFYRRVPLKRPYRLSFGALNTYDTFFVRLASDDGIGYGEITPLPGYSHETRQTVQAAANILWQGLESGETLSDVLDGLVTSDPFFVSGIKCGAETAGPFKEVFQNWERPISFPLTATCDAVSPQEMEVVASDLTAKGYGTLKIKVGKLQVVDEINRVVAAAKNVPSHVRICLDANQAYNYDQAAALCEGLEDIGSIALLEQPFKPENWEQTADLCRNTTVPIMLDEAIWTKDHIRMAAECGAKWVKFKLCKHPGISGSLDLANRARELNLSVVYGNGVQTALGNHIESWVQNHAQIPSSSESNGFLKEMEPSFQHGLTARNGILVNAGLPLKNLSFLEGERICLWCRDKQLSQRSKKHG